MSGRLRPISGVIVNGDMYRFRCRGKDYEVPYAEDRSGSDITQSFISGDNIIHVTVSQRFGYAGIEIYNFVEDRPIGNRFLQDESDIEEALGKKGLDLSHATIGEKLTVWLE